VVALADGGRPRPRVSKLVTGEPVAAGQLPTDFKIGIPPEARIDPNYPYYGSDIKKRTHYIMKNLKKTFEASGSSLDHIVKAQVFLEGFAQFQRLR